MIALVLESILRQRRRKVVFVRRSNELFETSPTSIGGRIRIGDRLVEQWLNLSFTVSISAEKGLRSDYQ